MLGLDARAARWTWTAAVILLLMAAVYQIRETIFVFIVSILFAYLLTPLLNFLNRVLPGKSRAPALAITYLILVGVLVVVVIEIGSRVAEEATSLAARAPQFIKNLQSQSPNIPLPPYLQVLKGDIFAHVQSFLQDHSSDIVSYLPTAGLKVLSLSSYLLYIVLVPILSFFLLKDGAAIRDGLLDLIPGGPRKVWAYIVSDTNVLLGQYVRAMGVLCLTVFVVFAIVFTILGVPYGILLAAVAFPLEFVPLVGPLTAAFIILLVTLASGYGNFLPILVFLGVYRMVQDYVLSPRLMSEGVEVHPLLVILGVLAGENIGGVPGMFLSVPVIALLRVVYRRVVAATSTAHIIQPTASTLVDR